MSLTLVYLLSALRGLAMGLFLPIWILNLSDQGFSLLGIGLLGTVFEVAKLCFEVPSGMFVDRFGIKRALVVSFSVSAVVWAIFPFLRSPMLPVGAMIIWALADALLSGTFETWISRLTDEVNFAKVLMRRSQVLIIAIIVGSMVSGLLYQWSPVVPFALVAALYLALTMTVSLGPTLPSLAEGDDTPGSWMTIVRDSLNIVVGHRRIALIVVAGFFSAMTYDAFARYWQPHLTALKLSAGTLGYVFAVAGVLTFVLLHVSTKLHLVIQRHTLPSLIIVEGAAAVLMLVTSYGLRAVAIVATPILLAMEDIRNPIVNGYLNKFFPTAYKTTLFSINSAVGAAGEIFAGVIFGVIAHRFGTRITLLAAAICLIPALLIYTITPGIREKVGSLTASARAGGQPK